MDRLPDPRGPDRPPEARILWDTSCLRDWEDRWGPTGLQDFFPYDGVSEDEYLDARRLQLGLAPRDVMPEDLAAIFRNSMDNW